MITTSTDTRPRMGPWTLAAAILAASALAGCDGTLLPSRPPSDGATLTSGGGSSAVERDIEAPEVFEATAQGLWDGRPSLGGVWVAHPDVTEPERVIIRNQSNGQFVIGALFKREREAPGPPLQVSSDAAAALGMLAGQPTDLNVVALRREAVEQDDAAASAAQTQPETGDGAAPLAPADGIEDGTLDPIASAAATALDNTAQTPPAPAAGPADDPRAAPPETASPLDRPFIQIGIFSVEQNARDTANAMRDAGMVPAVREQSSSGKTFWRVVVGPARSASERAALLETIREAGFTDAFATAD